MKRTLILIFTLCTLLSCNQDNNIIPINENDSESKFITLKSGVIVEKRGDDYILQGDILLFPEQLKSLDETGTLNPESNTIDSYDSIMHPAYNLPMHVYDSKSSLPRNLGINADPYRLWAMVRYTYGASILNHPNSAGMKAAIKSALEHIEDQTNVRFYTSLVSYHDLVLII